MSRPAFVSVLLSRPLPNLTPAALTDEFNPPYDARIRNEIADLQAHPLLESALHLLNDDLFSAHFLLRKMQEDEWGKWLHAILHLMEGDLEQNAKLWYEQVDPAVLGIYWDRFDQEDPRKAAIDALHRIMRIKAGEGDNEKQARQTKWDELVCIVETLGEKHGYGQVDGRVAYTKDEDESHKSRVLGEGYRRFDKAGKRI